MRSLIYFVQLFLIPDVISNMNMHLVGNLQNSCFDTTEVIDRISDLWPCWSVIRPLTTKGGIEDVIGGT